MGRGWGFHLISFPSPPQIRNWVKKIYIPSLNKKLSINYFRTLSEWEKSPRVPVPVEIFAIPSVNCIRPLAFANCNVNISTRVSKLHSCMIHLKIMQPTNPTKSMQSWK